MNLLMARVGDIKISGDNMREDAGDLRELSDSIKRYGVLQPLVVHTQGKKYALIAGHRRLAAARRAGLLEVPVVLSDDLTDADAYPAMIAENIHRKSLTPLEEARAFEDLRSRGYKQHEIGTLIHKSQPYVAKRLKLLECDEETQQKVHKGTMRLDVAIGYLTGSQKGIVKPHVKEGEARWQIYYMERLTMWLETGRVKVSDDDVAGRLVNLKAAITALAKRSSKSARVVSDLPMCDDCGTFIGPFFGCEHDTKTRCERCLLSSHVLARHEREEVSA